MKAAERFDFTKDFRFSTYATCWIKQTISRALAEQGRTIRLPVHVVETMHKISKASSTLTQDLGREPTPEEISAQTGISVSKIRETIQSALEPISIDAPVGDEEDSTMGEFIPNENAEIPEDSFLKNELQEEIRSILSTLKPREEQVLKLRFGLYDGKARTLEEVGRAFNITRERIRQIEDKAIRKLRHSKRCMDLMKTYTHI